MGFVRVRSVHSLVLWGTSGSFGCGRSIPVRPGCSPVRWSAFGLFAYALGVVGFFRVRSQHSRRPRWSSGSFRCVQFIVLRPGDRSGAVGPFPCTLGIIGCDRSIPVRHECRPVHSGAFDPFPYALEVVGFNRVHSVHSRAP